MGIYANYYFLDDSKLNQLKSSVYTADDIFEHVEGIVRSSQLFFDLHKLWDTLHCLLTGNAVTNASKNHLLSEAIIGITAIEGSDAYIAYIENDKLFPILSLLNAFDIEMALNNFNIETCKKADLYPNIWDYEDEFEEVKEELQDSFYQMKAFYQKTLDSKGHVLVTIS